jgi:hypothetical protein
LTLRAGDGLIGSSIPRRESDEGTTIGTVDRWVVVVLDNGGGGTTNNATVLDDEGRFLVDGMVEARGTCSRARR